MYKRQLYILSIVGLLLVIVVQIGGMMYAYDNTCLLYTSKTDCVHIMNIYDWGAPHGRWLTNFSSVYTSNDDGRTWAVSYTHLVQMRKSIALDVRKAKSV